MAADQVSWLLSHPFDEFLHFRMGSGQFCCGIASGQGTFIKQAVQFLMADPVQIGPVRTAFPPGDPMMAVRRWASGHLPSANGAGAQIFRVALHLLRLEEEATPANGQISNIAGHAFGCGSGGWPCPVPVQ